MIIRNGYGIPDPGLPFEFEEKERAWLCVHAEHLPLALRSILENVAMRQDKARLEQEGPKWKTN